MIVLLGELCLSEEHLAVRFEELHPLTFSEIKFEGLASSDVHRDPMVHLVH